VIYNPVAGAGVGAEASAAVEALLGRAGWGVRSIATRDRGGAAGIAREAARDVELLVVAGGDGTLREVIEGLGEEGERPTLGFVPTGNANIAARELGIPLEPREAMRILTDGKPVSIDLGVARWGDARQLFLAVVGIGWDAITVDYLDRVRHSTLGSVWYRSWADSAYLACGLVALLEWRPPRFRVTVDGEQLEQDFRGFHVCNFKTYAKGMSVTPDAHFQSGRLHYQARKRGTPLAVAWHIGAAALGVKVPRWISSYGEGHGVGVQSTRPFPLQIDGDFKGEATHLEVGVRPRAASILVPPAVADSAR
jgi:diacylglycerol kinase (ATP)